MKKEREEKKTSDIIIKIFVSFLIVHSAIFGLCQVTLRMWERLEPILLILVIFMLLLLAFGVISSIIFKSLKYRFLLSSVFSIESAIVIFLLSILLKAVAEASQAMHEEGSGGFGSMQTTSIDFGVLPIIFKIVALVFLLYGIIALSIQIYLILKPAKEEDESRSKPHRKPECPRRKSIHRTN